MQLPVEVLAIVFGHLPPKDLDTVRLVCREWRDVAGDRAWRQRFAREFGTTAVTRVDAAPQWRREFLTRQAVLVKWRRCAKECDVTLNSTLSDVSHLFANFAADTPRATCFNTHTGMGNMWDLDRGKMRRRLYASKYSHQLLPIASVDGSRFGLAYGFYSGEVATVSFTRDGTVVADYADLPYRHDTAVTALWLAKLRQLTKTPKRPDDAAVVASGATDGSIVLLRPGFHRCFRVTDCAIVLLEGTMHGTYARNDGSTVAALDIAGNLFLLDLVSEPRLLARLPFTLDTAQQGVELHMANDYVIVQTINAIYVADVHTGSVHTLRTLHGARICAFAIDKSYTPGTKYIAAGFANNEISVWALPPPLPTSSVRSGRSNVSSDTRSGARSVADLHSDLNLDSPSLPSSPASVPAFESASAPASVPALGSLPAPAPAPDSLERELDAAPLWTLPNPIGYDHRLDASGKPQITQVALNAAVLLVAGYNGVAAAMDVLSGQALKRVSSRISKNVLDLMLYSRDGFVPVTHLEIDPNPLRFRAIIVTRPAVQYLDLGPLDTRRTGRRHAARAKRASTPHVSSASRQDLAEEIMIRRELAELDEERESEQRALRETFSMDALAENEQLEYAMMLSEQAAADGSVAARAHADLDEDEQLRRALELSARAEREHSDTYEPRVRHPHLDSDGIYDEYDSSEHRPAGAAYDDNDDEALRRALALSAQEASSASPPAPAAGGGDDGIDEDLRRALELSLTLQ